MRGNRFRIRACRLSRCLSRAEKLRLHRLQTGFTFLASATAVDLRRSFRRRRRTGPGARLHSVGGWVKTWFEHMLEIERRRFTLWGKSPREVNDEMKGRDDALLRMADQRPHRSGNSERATELAELWPEGKDQRILWTSARILSAVTETESRRRLVAREGPDISCVDEYDWIMSREDHGIDRRNMLKQTPEQRVSSKCRRWDTRVSII